MINIKNFCIIAHIDHGKSTLADRLLELTGTVEKNKMRPQYLDMMDLEREKGITIKMQPVRMIYHAEIRNPKSEIPNKSQIQNSKSQTDNFEFRASNFEFSDSEYLLNLIDTPGHVDFNYEVSRSLAAVEGAILLVDATKGIQAQTLGNLELARKQNLTIIPVINKIDSPQAKVEATQKEIVDLLKVNPSDIINISARAGTNVEQVLNAVIERVPAPKGDETLPLRALVFDSKFDAFKGIIAFVRIKDGQVKKGEKIILKQSQAEGEVKEVGIFSPLLSPVEKLSAGEIGYLATGIKTPDKVRVGDTITILNSKVEGLPGYQEPKPMVFLSIFPENPDHFELLKDSLDKLKLNDAALSFKPDLKESLGRGFQCGFLGLLHAEIATERLKREFGLELVLSTPSVVYQVTLRSHKQFFAYTSADWPDPSGIESSQELWTRLQVLTPMNYLGQVLELLESLESKQLKTDYLGQEKSELVYEVPLREIITKNFYDKLKSVSQGFASMNYEILGWREAELVKLDILILGKKEEAFSKIVPVKDAESEGRKIVEKLKEVLPPQLFALPLQAAIGGKIIARETIRAKSKDVLAPLYGGDYTRKKKLLEQQKKGKKELKEKGRIKIPSRVFLEVFRT
ncbi:MAG: elongation factor 4 [Candidatus Nealsonbacteria bacterium RIFCSPLOWO2_01_FULL_43_32]|uniref:Elongation factor 4 n=1 Tax=Candidatus Nealsonbacteria bacterium RIFCSPLOWO2_01_FULL_43_32 TaxID=1801672 RepID=A0A1G2EGM1_9BACT|nr:MAG: elongation factor 4 [Candidatus Nealsonbacteria bacterium RIFCSPLOWO2_01_FULL_43_32]